MNVANEPAFLVLAIEAIMLLLVMLGVGAFWLFRQKKLDQNALQDFVANLKSGEAPHRDALQKMFSKIHRYEGDELSGAVDEVVAKERDVYRAMVGIYQNRDRSRLRSFNEAVEALVTLSTGMVPKTNDETFQKAITILTQERDRIDKELQDTKEAFENLMSEYTAAFDHQRVRRDTSKPDTPVPDAGPSTAVAAPLATGDVSADSDIAVDLPANNDTSPGQSQMFDTLDALDAALGTADDVPVMVNQPEPELQSLSIDDLAEVDIVDTSTDMTAMPAQPDSRSTGT